MPHCSLAVLISGRGSNLKAIIDAIESGKLDASISAVISNKADAPGLELARQYGLQTFVVDARQYADRDSYDQQLIETIDAAGTELVILAGFMRILGEAFIDHYRGRILNIHPSLLPDFKGLNTHQRAIDAGHKQHGASVHFVNLELDSGAVVLQAVVDILENDTATTLAERVLEQEHVIYPMAIQWFAQGRLTCDNDCVLFDEQLLEQPMTWKQDALQTG